MLLHLTSAFGVITLSNERVIPLFRHYLYSGRSRVGLSVNSNQKVRQVMVKIFYYVIIRNMEGFVTLLFIKAEGQNLADWGILICTFHKSIYF